jgi:hypothetical protein
VVIGVTDGYDATIQSDHERFSNHSRTGGAHDAWQRDTRDLEPNPMLRQTIEGDSVRNPGPCRMSILRMFRPRLARCRFCAPPNDYPVTIRSITIWRNP